MLIKNTQTPTVLPKQHFCKVITDIPPKGKSNSAKKTFLAVTSRQKIWWNFPGFDQQFLTMAFAFIAGGFSADWNSVLSCCSLAGPPCAAAGETGASLAGSSSLPMLRWSGKCELTCGKAKLHLQNWFLMAEILGLAPDSCPIWTDPTSTSRAGNKSTDKRSVCVEMGFLLPVPGQYDY